MLVLLPRTTLKRRLIVVFSLIACCELYLYDVLVVV